MAKKPFMPTMLDFQPCNVEFGKRYRVRTQIIECVGLFGLVGRKLTKDVTNPDTLCYHVFNIRKQTMGFYYIATDGEKYFDITGDWHIGEFEFTKSKKKPDKCPDIIDKTIIQAFIAADVTGSDVPVEIK